MSEATSPGTSKIRKIEILLAKLIPWAVMCAAPPRGGAALLFESELDAVVGAVLDVFPIEFPADRAEPRAAGRHRRGLLHGAVALLLHGIAHQPAAQRPQAGADRRARAGMAGLVADDRARSRSQQSAQHRPLVSLGLRGRAHALAAGCRQRCHDGQAPHRDLLHDGTSFGWHSSVIL